MIKNIYRKLFIDEGSKKILIIRGILEYLLILTSFIIIPFLLTFMFNEEFNYDKINIYYSISGALMFSAIWIIGNIRIKQVLYTISFSLIYIYMIVQYFYQSIMNKYFSVFDMYNLGEGTDYINYLSDYITLKFILVIIIGVVICLSTNKMIRIANKQKIYKNIFVRYISRAVLILIILYVSDVLNYKANETLHLEHLEAELEGIYQGKYAFEQSRFQKVENFTDKNSVFNTVHLYKYLYYDISEYLVYLTTDNSNLEVITAKLDENDKSKEDNEYTGIFKDENIIVILLETIDTWIVNEEYMPTLTKLSEEGMSFTNHYTEIVSGGATHSAEYAAITGFYMPLNYNIYDAKNYDYPQSLASLFNQEKYKTSSVHFNTGSFYNRSDFHPSWGFASSNFLDDMGYKNDYHIDTNLLNDEIYPMYTDKEDTFMSFIITYTAHGPYQEEGQDEIEVYGKRAKVTDDFLKGLIERLETDSLLDNTTLVLIGDHYNYSLTDPTYVENIKIENNQYELLKTPFVIWNNRMESEEFTGYTGMTDLVPTLANMFDLDYNPNYYQGDDIFSETYRNYLYFDTGAFAGENKEDYDYAKEALDLNDSIIKTNYFKYNKYE